jgi:mRNA interferase RelE/StbE
MPESGPAWEIIFERQAEKMLRRLPTDLLHRIDQAVMGLAQDPRPAGCRKLRGYQDLYRLRVGDWRIIYAVKDDRLIVLVLEIAPRGEVYRNR